MAISFCLSVRLSICLSVLLSVSLFVANRAYVRLV